MPSRYCFFTSFKFKHGLCLKKKKYSIFYETKSFEGLLKGYFAHGKAEKAKDYSVVQRRDIIYDSEQL